MTSISGISSRISREIVPWPAITWGVVEGMYEGVAVIFPSIYGFRSSIVEEIAVEDDVRAVTARSGYFHLRSMFRHADRRLAAVYAGG